MAFIIQRSAEGPSSGRIVCDHPGCGCVQPSTAEVLRAGGLIALGWRCSGGTHFCPDHNPDNEGKSPCSK